MEGDGRYTRNELLARLMRRPDSAWDILDRLVKVAADATITPAQAALNWVSRQPTVTSPIIGASSVAQLDDNLAALDTDLELTELTEASKPALHHPYNIFDPEFRRQAPFTVKVEITPQP